MTLHRYTLAIVLASSIGPCAAAQMLRDVIFDSTQSVQTIDIRLGHEADVAAVTNAEPRLLQLHLESKGAPGYTASEMEFDEDDQAIERIAIEGSRRAGYVLSIAFRRHVEVEVLPQFDRKQVLLKLAPKRAYKRLSKFPKRPDGSTFAVALRDRPDAVPKLADIPKAFAGRHEVYFTPSRGRVETSSLRLGFFATEAAAQSAVVALATSYPAAAIVPVSQAEVAYAHAFKINPGRFVARFGIDVEAANRQAKHIGFEITPVTRVSIVEVEPEIAAPLSEWTAPAPAIETADTASMPSLSTAAAAVANEPAPPGSSAPATAGAGSVAVMVPAPIVEPAGVIAPLTGAEPPATAEPIAATEPPAAVKPAAGDEPAGAEELDVVIAPADVSPIATASEAGSDGMAHQGAPELSEQIDTPAMASEVRPGESELIAKDESNAATGADALLIEAQRAFAAEDYEAAIGLFTKLRRQSTNAAVAKEALEMLAVSRELNHQLAHAKRLYEEYLTAYAAEPEAARVEQRLTALLAVDRAPQGKLRAAKRSLPDPGWQVAGNISQFYQRRTLDVDGDTSVPINGLFNDINVFATRQGDRVSHETNVSISYLADFTKRLNGRAFRASTLYWDSDFTDLGTSFRLGRQSRHATGTLGRFDGISVDQRVHSRISLGAVAGFAIDSSFDGPSTERPFYGLHATIDSPDGRFRFDPFIIEQRADGLLDRRAVGFQTQVRSKRLNAFSLVDYDVHHKALNNLNVTSNFVFRPGSTLSATYDFRRSPFLTTRNALIGQPFNDLTELEQEIIDMELGEIAADRTATNQTVRLALNARVSQRWSVYGDVTGSHTSGTETSANVTGFEAQDGLYYSLQVRSSNVFGSSNYSALTIRRAELESSSTTSMIWNGRFVFAGTWSLQPRLRYDERKFTASKQTQSTVIPTLRLDYRHGRRLRFELETGYEWTTRHSEIRDFDISGLLVRVGYRALF